MRRLAIAAFALFLSACSADLEANAGTADSNAAENAKNSNDPENGRHVTDPGTGENSTAPGGDDNAQNGGAPSNSQNAENADAGHGNNSGGPDGGTDDVGMEGGDDGGGDPGGSDANTLAGRSASPVVVRGAELSGLLGVEPADVVGFVWENGWTQVPVQVDEKVPVPTYQHYSGVQCNRCPAPGEISPRTTTVAAAYADPRTFTGADPTAVFDIDDELVFMARDTGGVPGNWSLPGGVANGTAVRIDVTDPTDGGTGTLFVFESDGSLDAAAGRSYVSYDFAFDGGGTLHDMSGYRANYNRLGDGTDGSIPDCPLGGARWTTPNEEMSAVFGSTYEAGFSERWIHNDLFLGGTDILDTHLNRFSPLTCGRSNASFSGAEGGFIANYSGPVRTVRCVIGANSGPETERCHFFYDRGYTVATTLRVHQIPGVMDLYDYDPVGAAGMQYANNNNPNASAVIDGQDNENLTGGELEWETVTGGPGTLVMSHELLTSIAPSVTRDSYFQDETNASCQCLGDGNAYGVSGQALGKALDITSMSEPALPDTYGTADDYLTALREVWVYDSELDPSALGEAVDRITAPLEVVTRSVSANGGGLGDSCGDGTCQAGESCPVDCATNRCGDGVCDLEEVSGWCPADCPWASCGDGTCQDWETNGCAADCGGATDTCGDGVCTGGETEATCPQDCGQSTGCGDGTCASDEDRVTCPLDCGSDQQAALACLYTDCSANYQACTSDTGGNSCSGALDCIATCTDSTVVCAQTCGSQATGASGQLYDTTIQCGAAQGCAN